MKKLIAVTLVFIISIAFFGCSKIKVVETGPKDFINITTTEQTYASTTTDILKTKTTTVTTTTTAATTEFFSDEPLNFKEIAIVDHDFCNFTITRIGWDSYYGHHLKAIMENKSTDRTFTFKVNDGAVNGLQSDHIFSSVVAPGKKANGEIYFTEFVLDEIDIDEFTDIELNVSVYDSDVWWTADLFTEGRAHIYPKGEENATVYVRKSRTDDITLIDNNLVTVTYVTNDFDDSWGSFWRYNICLYLENKSDKNLVFSAEQVSVNGFMTTPLFSRTILPTGNSSQSLIKIVLSEKSAYNFVSWFESDFESNDISKVEEIEMLLLVYEADAWMADYLVNERIIINP